MTPGFAHRLRFARNLHRIADVYSFMRIQHFFTALTVAALLAACAGQPKATPSAPTASATAAAVASATVPPSPAPSDTASATAAPALPGSTPTRPVGPTATQAAGAAAAEAAAPTVAPARPEPDTRLLSARWRQLIGDCDSARREFVALLADHPAPAAAAEARYRMAQCYLRDAAPAEASIALAELLSAAPEADPYRAPAQFLLGEALSALSRWAEAEAAYTAYLPLAPELEYLTWQRIGAAQRSAGDTAGAAAAYRAALAVSPDWTNTVAIRRILADLALEAGKAQEAVAQYDALRGAATTGSWAAEMFYLAGNALAQGAILDAFAGPPTAQPTAAIPPALAEAQSRWQAAVDADVTSRYAHSAIVALLDSGAAVDEYQRGRANYHTGVYGLAIAAFDRLRAGSGALPADAAYYAGLSYLAQGDNAGGLAELDRFIAAAPDDPLWAEAWLAKARAQARAERTAEAIATYRRLAERRPNAPQAAKALWQAALLADNGPDPATAQTYLALARRYPKADEGWRAYQAAGLIYFRLGNWRNAADTWREMSENAELPAWTRPAALFWLGRSQAALGAQADALKTWQAVAASWPDSFYGLRAADWARGQTTPAAKQGSAEPRADATQEPAAERADIAAWLRTWAGEGRLDLPAAVAADGDWQRGQTLLALGLRTQALANWNRVQQRYAEQPWTLSALALAFRDAGAHRLSLISAEQVVTQWGGVMRAAPAALQRLAYPFPYTELVRGEAEKRGLDARLLTAIIRQESRFEAGVASVAGAQGLMQVMPGTAQGIADQLGWTDFAPQQAYWPYVNVAFGAFYVSQWLNHFEGSVFAALAAYNGGPGNAAVWHAWAPDDDDLMAALININETRVYVQAVWANYKAYQRLYSH